MTKKTIKKYLQDVIKLHKNYIFELTKLEQKLNGNIISVVDTFVEFEHEEGWYSLDNNKLVKHTFLKETNGTFKKKTNRARKN